MFVRIETETFCYDSGALDRVTTRVTFVAALPADAREYDSPEDGWFSPEEDRTCDGCVAYYAVPTSL